MILSDTKPVKAEIYARVWRTIEQSYDCMTSTLCLVFGENPSHLTINTCNKYYHHHHHHHLHPYVIYWFLAYLVKFCQQIKCHRPLNVLSVRQMPFVISAPIIWAHFQYSIDFAMAELLSQRICIVLWLLSVCVRKKRETYDETSVNEVSNGVYDECSIPPSQSMNEYTLHYKFANFFWIVIDRMGRVISKLNCYRG